MKICVVLYKCYFKNINIDNNNNVYKISYKDSNIKNYFKNYQTDYYLHSNNDDNDELKEYFNPKIVTNLKIDDLLILINIKKKMYDIIVLSPYNTFINFDINQIDKKNIYFKNDFYIFYKNNMDKFLKNYKLNNNNFKLLNDINFIKKYDYDINLINCIIIISKNENIKYKIVPIKNTPHYKYINGDKTDYLNYISKNYSTKHSSELYDKLIKNYKHSKDKFKIKEKHKKIILFDGIHRLSILLSKNVKFVKLKYQHKFDILDKRKHIMI